MLKEQIIPIHVANCANNEPKPGRPHSPTTPTIRITPNIHCRCMTVTIQYRQNFQTDKINASGWIFRYFRAGHRRNRKNISIGTKRNFFQFLGQWVKPNRQYRYLIHRTVVFPSLQSWRRGHLLEARNPITNRPIPML